MINLENTFPLQRSPTHLHPQNFISHNSISELLFGKKPLQLNLTKLPQSFDTKFSGNNIFEMGDQVKVLDTISYKYI
ncbi:hypothetical protein WKK05_32140 [Nostoc sp. UHCC 0302]|uniref:hypothetical protein n=1 Tax=Nostoc sp. UHCC 0302 TaxID=3134896 RepID=UPI00311C9580